LFGGYGTVLFEESSAASSNDNHFEKSLPTVNVLSVSQCSNKLNQPLKIAILNSQGSA
jgi:hypothetical protein